MGNHSRIIAMVFSSLLVGSSASLLVGCGPARLDKVALGKVIIYRNGVAYFERFATVKDGELSLLVAQNKVDDLLKSLTVTDVQTGETLPISFPAREVSKGLIRMTVRVPGKKTRTVKLSYVSESPAWKPSYRLTLADDGQVKLQGWAIVDNRSGEDWENVLIGVASTSALSFRYDLWSVRDVHRQTLGHNERLATAPPTATGLVHGDTKSASDANNPNQPKNTNGVTLDQDYTRNIPVPGRSFESALGAVAGAAADGMGVSFSGSTSLENQYVVDGVNTTGLAHGRVQPRSAKEVAAEKSRRELYARAKEMVRAETAKAHRRNDQLARQLARSEGNFIIEAIASPSEQNSQAAALSMANHLRNELINRGVAPGRLIVETRVGAIGEPTTLRVTPQDPEDASEGENNIVGKSKFMSRTPLSIPHQGTSMISIVDEKTVGSLVYLYDAVSARGNKHYAFQAIRFRNPTEQHLEGGPITVFGDGSFIGEGLTDSIAPGASAILPFALDKQIYVDRQESFDDTIVGFRGVHAEGAIVAKQRLSTVSFSVHNRSQNKAKVYIRHDSNSGWQLKKGPSNLERLGQMSVFSVELGPGERETVKIVEFTPITATLDLTVDAGIDELENYLSANQVDAPFDKAARELVAAHRSISKKLKTIDHVAGEMVIYRNRLDELHIQLFTLKAINSRGRLLRNLSKRMDAMSTRVQKAIVEIIELRDEIMVERFAYRDLIVAAISIAPAE